jgi:hypothetical protein
MPVGHMAAYVAVSSQMPVVFKPELATDPHNESGLCRQEG